MFVHPSSAGVQIGLNSEEWAGSDPRAFFFFSSTAQFSLSKLVCVCLALHQQNNVSLERWDLNPPLLRPPTPRPPLPCWGLAELCSRFVQSAAFGKFAQFSFEDQICCVSSYVDTYTSQSGLGLTVEKNQNKAGVMIMRACRVSSRVCDGVEKSVNTMRKYMSTMQ